jgi:hypothetical protein
VSSELLQQRLEAKNQVLNSIHQLMERWEKRITFRNLRLFERFTNFELNLILHFSVEDSAEMRLACFHPKGVELAAQRMVNPGRLENCVAVDGEQEPVFVDVVKFVESPEKLITSAVRFESIDRFYSLRPHTLYFSSLLPFVSSDILRNRKTTSPRGLITGDQNELVCKVVEGTSEVLDNISSSCDRIEWNGPKPAEFTLFMESGLSVLFSQDDVCVCTVRREFPLKSHEVLLGPLNFYADQDQSAVCG